MSDAELSRLVDQRLPAVVRSLRTEPEFKAVPTSAFSAGRPIARFGMWGEPRADPWRAIGPDPVDHVVPVLVDGRPAADFVLDARTRGITEIAWGAPPAPAPASQEIEEMRALVRGTLGEGATLRAVTDGVWQAAIGWTASGRCAAAFVSPGFGGVEGGLSDRGKLLESIESMRVYEGQQAIDLINAVFLGGG